ncbi:DUF3240 family protein [Pseudidiomarina salilacus]|uniref:DUF3240 family protein n=1 Tax=Pseudidiomarina salilacus TaxID=3384452 RepID=UPI003984C751
MSLKLLKIYFSEAQKPDVIDALLKAKVVSGFSVYAIDGFGRVHERYDISEQIRGARRMVIAEVVCEPDVIKAVEQAISTLHFKDPIRYMVHNVEDCGHWH